MLLSSQHALIINYWSGLAWRLPAKGGVKWVQMLQRLREMRKNSVLWTGSDICSWVWALYSAGWNMPGERVRRELLCLEFPQRHFSADLWPPWSVMSLRQKIETLCQIGWINCIYLYFEFVYSLQKNLPHVLKGAHQPTQFQGLNEWIKG